jgi:triacylglycerol lipase
MNDTGSTNLNLLDLIQEFRAVGEFARFARRAWTWPFTARAEHPRSILLIPGFMAGDSTLYPFADWLRSRGHQVYFSGILANANCPRRAVDRLVGIAEDLARHGREKLVVIGHSLGGIYARELARRLPQHIEQVILLGSPIRGPLANSNPFVRMLAVFVRNIHESRSGCRGELANVCGVHSFEPPPGVPETLIYTKRDGVVDWMSCVESGPDVAAFEVHSTHCGLPYNLETLRIVRERIEHA